MTYKIEACKSTLRTSKIHPSLISSFETFSVDLPHLDKLLSTVFGQIFQSLEIGKNGILGQF